MFINQVGNSNASFKAKFLDTKSLHQIVDYAVEKGKYQELRHSVSEIDKGYLRTRIAVNLDKSEKGYPRLTFYRYVPKKDIAFPSTINDYVISEPIVYEHNHKMNPLKYGLQKLIKMGRNIPLNKTYKRVVCGN